jgi:hypothetical protein
MGELYGLATTMAAIRRARSAIVSLEITIRSQADQWVLSCPSEDISSSFLSGARAEGEGRRLAQSFADAGNDVELVIILRDEVVAARLPFKRRFAA